MKILRAAMLCVALIVMTSPAVVADAVRVHGTIQSVGPGRTLVLKADDGRTVTVDFSRDDIDARLLTVGEKITVSGESGGQAGPLRAHSIVQDESRKVQRLHGTIQSVGPGRRLVLKTDDGRTVNVDFSRDDIDLRLLTVGEKITVAGMTGKELNVFTAHNVVQDESRKVQRLHGIIHSLGPGRRLVLKTDDGRTVNVDFSRDDIDPRLLTVGEKVTVVGVTGREANVFTAQNIRQDEARQVQRLHGTIASVGPGRKLVLKTDDGCTLNVDFSGDANLDVRQLRQGERATVTGVTGREPDVFTARNVVPEHAAASPPTTAPAAKEDCFRDGWRRFTNPKFKNQGDCVSHVNARDKGKK